MIKTQIVKEGKRPIAVVMDYKEYKRLKEIEEDLSSLEIKLRNKKWKSHTQVKKELRL